MVRVVRVEKYGVGISINGDEVGYAQIRSIRCINGSSELVIVVSFKTRAFRSRDAKPDVIVGIPYRVICISTIDPNSEIMRTCVRLLVLRIL